MYADLLPPAAALLFPGFFLGGFEGSSHRRRDGVQLDMIRRTRHDIRVEEDYALVSSCGITIIRDALRWHKIELFPGHYDWSSALPMLRAAREGGLQVIWDLCHYGLPHDIDIFSTEFVERFADFANAAARIIQDHSDGPVMVCPMNEISFWAWAGSDRRKMYPWAPHRGGELKRQLVRAAIAATDAVRAVDPGARFVQSEPLIHVVGRPGRREEAVAAERHRTAQFEACDMLSGRMLPELGGSDAYLDIVGLNYYPDNQWIRPNATLANGPPVLPPAVIAAGRSACPIQSADPDHGDWGGGSQRCGLAPICVW